MKVRFCLKVSVYFWGHGIWVSYTSFQKSNIGWPHQPSTGTVPYIWKFRLLMNHSTKNEQYWSFWCHWWSNHRNQEVFGKIKLLRPMRLQRPLRSIRLQWLLRPGEISMRTSDSSWFLNSIFWGLKYLSLVFWKKVFLTESWKLKCHNLRNTQIPSNKI